MTNVIDDKQIDQIIIFLKSLNIKSKRFCEMINTKDQAIIQTFSEALTHSSCNKAKNYEKLEFFGDAVLRLAASIFIDKKYTNLSVGERSELRAQLVSDEWLTKLGKKIDIYKVINKGPKVIGDKYSKDTIIAEASEALIGAMYKCFYSIQEINIWLDEFWEKDSKVILESPYKFNSKSLLQEWCQSKGFNLPIYKIIEISKNHADPKRFLCEIYINGSKESHSFGHSHKKAEKKAASFLIEKFIKEGKINSSHNL